MKTLNAQAKQRIQAAARNRWAKIKAARVPAQTEQSSTENMAAVSQPPLRESPVLVKGTWDGVRRWLNAAKMFEQRKLFSQVMVGFELLALHKAHGVENGKKTVVVPHNLSQSGKGDANTDIGGLSVADSWEAICERETGISRNTGYRYMDMAKVATPRLKLFPALKNFDPFKESLQSLKPAVQEALQTAVKKLTDGKTQGEFFDELYKQGGKGAGRDPGCDGTKKKLTLSEEAALRQEQARLDWQACWKALTAYGDKFVLLTDEDAMAQVATLEQVLNARQAWLKQPLNERNPKAIAEMLFQASK